MGIKFEEQEITELAEFLCNFRDALTIPNVKASIKSFLKIAHIVCGNAECLIQEEEEAELVAGFINRGWIPPDEAKKYAKLADDQSLPEYYHPNYMLLGDGGRRDWDNKEIEIREAQQDMLTVRDGTVWRKVEVKDGN